MKVYMSIYANVRWSLEECGPTDAKVASTNIVTNAPLFDYCSLCSDMPYSPDTPVQFQKSWIILLQQSLSWVWNSINHQPLMDLKQSTMYRIATHRISINLLLGSHRASPLKPTEICTTGVQEYSLLSSSSSPTSIKWEDARSASADSCKVISKSAGWTNSPKNYYFQDTWNIDIWPLCHGQYTMGLDHNWPAHMLVEWQGWSHSVQILTVIAHITLTKFLCLCFSFFEGSYSLNFFLMRMFLNHRFWPCPGWMVK